MWCGERPMPAPSDDASTRDNARSRNPGRCTLSLHAAFLPSSAWQRRRSVVRSLGRVLGWQHLVLIGDLGDGIGNSDASGALRHELYEQLLELTPCKILGGRRHLVD